MPVLPGGFLVALSISGWGGSRSEKTNNDLIQIKINKLPRKFFVSIDKRRAEAYRCLRHFSQRFPALRGVYWVPNTLKDQAEARLISAREAYLSAVDDAMTQYAEYKEIARPLLGSRYDETDYPSEDELRQMFTFRYHLFSVAETDTRLEGANTIQHMLDEFQAVAYTELTSTFAETLARLVRQLEEGRRFHASTYENFKEFLETFQALASCLSDNRYTEARGKLERLMAHAKETLGNNQPKDIRDDDHLREFIRNQLVVVQERFSQEMSAIRLGDRSIVF
jgi:hypothetical protein